MIKCGAFWNKIAKSSGTEYWSGEITINEVKTKVVMFKNTKKDKENQPDLQVYLQEEKKENIPF